MMRNKQDLSENRHAYDLNNVINECYHDKKLHIIVIICVTTKDDTDKFN